MAEKPPGKPPEPPKKSSAPKLAAKALTDNAASPQGVSAAEGCKQLDKVNSTGPGTVYCIKRPGQLCPGACALG